MVPSCAPTFRPFRDSLSTYFSPLPALTISSCALVSYRSEKSMTSARSGVQVNAAMPMSTPPACTAGMMPSNA